MTVLPITHRPPAEGDAAVEIPPKVKRHLKLDDERSWIVVSEGNEFAWPEYDLRKVPQTDQYHYGFLPPRLFDRVVEAFVAYHRSRRARLAPRD